jgi:drug/metabolite transporter (DMT)-like permease
MSPLVFVALLGAAALHAGWNALIRRDPDRDAAALAIAAGGAVLGVALIPFLPRIAPAAIPFAIASSFIHVVYYAMVARAFRLGELSVAYPIMRGLAPLIVTIIGIVFIESVGPAVLAGVVIVTTGILFLGFDGRGNGHGAIATALLNALVIAGYTIVDGLGARLSDAPVTYVAWIEIGGGVGTVIYRLVFNGHARLAPILKRIPSGFAGAAMGFAAYGIALWAMTLAPIGAVAAVRESSVLFATAIGAVMLHERFGATRWIAAAVVVAGLALVKLGG